MNVARILSKFTPASPISWLLELLRGSGVNTEKIDESSNNLGSSLLGKYAGTNLTEAEREANAFNAQEAQKNRDFESVMRKTSYSDEVQGMKDAGLNPAVMLASGGSGMTVPSGSTASSVSPSASSLSDLMNLILLPAQVKNLNAQTANIEERTRTQQQITRIQTIAANFGVELTEAQISTLISQAQNYAADSSLKQSQKDFVTTQADAQRVVNSYLDAKQQAELSKLNQERDSLEASEKLSRAQAFFTNVQAEYADKNHMLMSSNDMLLVATYIGELLGISKDDVTKVIRKIASGPRNSNRRSSGGER